MRRKQTEILKKMDLLNKEGRLICEGWARHPFWVYDRGAIKAGKWRIKEWDYYAITSLKNEWTITVTVSDLGYAAMFAIAFIDLKRKSFVQSDAIKFFSNGKIGLSPDSVNSSYLTWFNEDLRISFIKKGEKRHLLFSSPSLVLPDGRVGIDVIAELTQPKEMETMNIATSWKENRKAFYLNEKVNCMNVVGTVRFGNDLQVFEKDDVWATLDWGRGRWTYKNQWYWASCSGLLDGVRFGLNLGYGFSDRSSATENVIFYDGVIHKLEDVDFNIPKTGFVKEPWHFTSNNGRLDLLFDPIVNRSSNTDFKIIKSVQNQVFGKYSGKIILDDGKELTLSNFPGFAEDVYNKW